MRGRILIIDDEEVMRELLRLHLTSAGYTVQVAVDAISAGYEMLQNPPDLIMCDVEMPHMNGVQLISALRADKTVPDVPVIFLTSVDEGEVRADEMSAGYLQKPVRLEALLAAVQRYLPRR